MVIQTHGQAINDLQTGKSIRLAKVERGGSLEARRLPSGSVAFYWRHTRAGKTERIPIGPYDPSAPPKALKPGPRGYAVAAALEAARVLAKLDSEAPGGLRAERSRQQAAEEVARKEELARGKYTLQALCDEYCNWLERQGKDSHREARNILRRNLLEPHPELAATAANRVGKRPIVEAARKLTEAGKSTTGRKLRSYLRAAYACALRADSDATLPSSFIAFNITTNPVESITPIKGKTDKNPLSLADLRKYWKQLQKEPGVIGAALRLQLLSGAQRVAQLARLHERDVTTTTIQLFDPKGKRVDPRPHLLPITKPMRAELAQLAPTGYVLSTDGGITPMHPTSISAWAADAGKRAGIEGFQLKRVRSGVETALASVRVSKDVRGQLQSHGLGGVQDAHYDAHEYLPVKRQALDTLHKLLEAEPAKNVTPIKRKRAA
jgi:hypothetical protein